MPIDDQAHGGGPGDGPGEGSGDDEAVVVLETGRRGQRLICEGWFASHADSGTPGPHVQLRTSDGAAPVLRTDQLPGLVAAVTTVGERIDRLWAADGDEYASEVVLRTPDPQDPRVVRQRRLQRMRFTQDVLDHLPEVMRLLTEAASTDEALAGIAALLDVDEVDAMAGLARFDLLTLTRPATERRLRTLADPDG